MNIVTAILVLSVLVVIHELGHFWAARRKGVGVEKFSVGFGPRIWGIRRGETEYVISAIPFGGYVKMVGESGESGEETVERDDSFSAKSPWSRMLIAFAGPACNFLFALLLFYVVYLVGGQILLAGVGTVQPDSAAAAAGLEPGDVIEAIDDTPVETWEEMTGIVRASAGVTRRFKVRRDGEEIVLEITPRLTTGKSIFGEEKEIGLIGITPAELYRKVRYGPLEAAGRSVGRIGEIVWLTLVGIVKMFQRVVPADQLGGPIMIVQMAGKVAETGLMNLIAFTGFISTILALFNLFPIPVLDGGHIWFYLVEGLRGRPLSLRSREVMQQVGLVLLVMLMLFATYNDIMRFFTPEQ